MGVRIGGFNILRDSVASGTTYGVFRPTPGELVVQADP